MNTPSALTTRPVLKNGNVPSPNPLGRLGPSGAGILQVHPCATAAYSLVDGGATMYHAPFVECIPDKQDCCPFLPAANPKIVNDQKPMVETTSPSNYADRYYVVSGQCCPKYVDIFKSSERKQLKVVLQWLCPMADITWEPNPML